MGIEDARVIEEDVEVSEGGDGFINGAAAFSSLADIGAQKDGFTAVFEDPGSDGMSALFMAAGDGDLGAFFGKQQGRGFANASKCLR